MKKHARFHDPVNYRLTTHDVDERADFSSFLTRISDIPASVPAHPIAITKTGISNQQVIVHIEGFEQKQRSVPMLCEVAVSVDLKQKRGIHMSRCVQAIFDLATKKFPNLDEFAA